MPETTPGSPKAVWWVVVAIVAVVALAAVFFISHRTQQTDQAATANGTGQGTAYSAATGNVVPANAAPGALNQGSESQTNVTGSNAGSP